MSLTKQRVTNDYHHIADRSGRAAGALHAVAAIEEVVRRKIFEQVAEQTLYEQRDNYSDGNVAPGILGLAAHGGNRFEADQDQDCHRGLNEHPAPVVRADDRELVGVRKKCAAAVGRRIADLIGYWLAR